MAASQRAAHEDKVMVHLANAKHRLSRVKRAVLEKAQAREHPLHVQLTRVKGAIQQAQSHLNTKMKMHLRAQKETEAKMKAEEEAARLTQEQKQLEQDISSASEEMRRSFAKQMAGRLYVDWHTIQMRSQVTGQVSEWPMDDARASALGRLMGNWDAIRTLERVRGRQSSLAARFEVVSGEDGIRLVLDGGERTISAEAVVFSPQKYVVAL
jgi:chromosome segregation ATPase